MTPDPAARPAFSPGWPVAVIAPPVPRDRKAAASRHIDHDVPSRWRWLFDVLLLVVAFPVTRNVAEWLQPLVRRGGESLAILQRLAIPNASSAAEFPPLQELLWIPLLMIPATLLGLSALGGHRALLSQSRTRLLVSTIGAPLLQT